MFLNEKVVVIISCSLFVSFNRSDVQFSLSFRLRDCAYAQALFPKCTGIALMI